jgi:hypothetical protein
LYHPLAFPFAVSSPNDTYGAGQSYKENNLLKHFWLVVNSMGKFQPTSAKFQTTFKSQVKTEKIRPEFVFLNLGFVPLFRIPYSGICDLEFDYWNFKQHTIFMQHHELIDEEAL